MYMYPDDLKGKATLWLWYLRDIGIIGITAIIGIISVSQIGFYLPLALTCCYAFLTIRMQDTSIFDFLSYAFAYFVFEQQFYLWEYTRQSDMDTNHISHKRWRNS